MSATETFDVFVANLIPTDTEGDLRNIFDVVGDIHSVKILPPKEGESKNVAFVRFLHEKDAECAARYFNNHLLEDNRTLVVRYRNKQDNHSRSPKKSNGFSNTPTTNGFRHSSSSSDSSPNEEETLKKTVMVVHVESPNSFYGQNVATEDATKLSEITEELEKCCPTRPKVIGNMSSQQIYGCKFSEDGMWYRCSVGKCLPKNEVEVRYIDYGNSEVVDRFGLVSLPISLTSQQPLAICYQFQNLELVDDDASSSIFQTGVNKLKELLGDKCLELTVKASGDEKLMFVKGMKASNEVFDVSQLMLSTGTVKLKPTSKTSKFVGLQTILTETVQFNNELLGFTQPPANTKTPFSNFRKSSSPTELRPNGTENGKVNGFHKEESLNAEIQNLKIKLAQKEAALNEMRRSSSNEINELKKTVKSQVEDLNTLNEEMGKLKIDTENKSTVNTSFTNLLSKVEELREIRLNSPVGDEPFSKQMQAVVDLYATKEDTVLLSTMSQYNNVQIEQENLTVQRDAIMKCSDKEEMTELLEERDNIIRKCVKSIRTLLKHVDTLPLKSREEELEGALDYLKNNFSNLVESDLKEDTDSLDKSILLYKDEKARSDSGIKRLREVTNDKSSKVFKVLGQYQRELHCIVNVKLSTVTDDIDQSIEEYGKAIDEEITATKIILEEMKESEKLKNVVHSLYKSIRTELDDVKILRSYEFKEKYEDLIEKYKISVKNKPDTSSLLKARKNIKSLKSKFRHKQADLIDLEEDSDETEEGEIKEIEKDLDDIRTQLHRQFLTEHNEMIKLAEACKGNFPELIKLHPELSLEEFIESNNLWQKSRTIDHYIQKPPTTLRNQGKQITLKCVFDENPCVIKEISLSNQTQNLMLQNVLERIISYTKEDRVNCVKIQCVFTDKSERKLYYHQDYASEGNLIQFLEKNQPEPKVLKTVFKDLLQSLASNPNPHCGIKPENVLICQTDDGTRRAVLAEPSFICPQEKSMVSCLNANNTIPNYPKLDLFINPPKGQADMICLAGVMLWAFHKDKTFTEMIYNDLETHVSDTNLMNLLKSMLSADPNSRLTPVQALAHDYFEQVDDVDISKIEENENEEENQEDLSQIVNVDESSVGATAGVDLTTDISSLNLEDTLPVSKATEYDSSDDVTIEDVKDSSTTASVDDLIDLSADKKDAVASQEDNEQAEQDAWEKALLEKNLRKKEKALEEKPVAQEEVTISDDDDF